MLFLIIAMLSDINSPTFLFYFTKRWFHFVDNVILLLILHTDVAIIIVQKTNDLMQNFLGTLYVGPRKTHSSHFIKKDTKRSCPPEYLRKNLVRALILRIIEIRFN